MEKLTIRKNMDTNTTHGFASEAQYEAVKHYFKCIMYADNFSDLEVEYDKENGCMNIKFGLVEMTLFYTAECEVYCDGVSFEEIEDISDIINNCDEIFELVEDKEEEAKCQLPF